jgi:hypothetical protein
MSSPNWQRPAEGWLATPPPAPRHEPARGHDRLDRFTEVVVCSCDNGSVDSTTLNVAALIASGIALVVSVVFAVRQARLMHSSNQLPVVISFMNEYRSDEFLRRERQLWEELPGRHDPETGFERMPEPLRSHMYYVGIFYQTIAYLVANKIYHKRLAYLPYHYRLIKTWNVLEPFVQGERRLRGASGTFLNAAEEFVQLVRREDDHAFGPNRLQYSYGQVEDEATPASGTE